MKNFLESWCRCRASHTPVTVTAWMTAAVTWAALTTSPPSTAPTLTASGKSHNLTTAAFSTAAASPTSTIAYSVSQRHCLYSKSAVFWLTVAIRLKIIRTVLCCIVYHSSLHSCAHSYEQFLQVNWSLF